MRDAAAVTAAAAADCNLRLFTASICSVMRYERERRESGRASGMATDLGGVADAEIRRVGRATRPHAYSLASSLPRFRHGEMKHDSFTGNLKSHQMTHKLRPPRAHRARPPALILNTFISVSVVQSFPKLPFYSVYRGHFAL